MSWRSFCPRTRHAWLSVLISCALLASGVVRAEEPAPASSRTLLARHELWLSLSATLLTASIAGSFGLRVAARNDRIDALPRNSLERPDLAQQAVDARRFAWGFGTAASLCAITTLLVLIYQPGDSHAAQLAPSVGAGQLGIHYQRGF